jgi:DNA sulfur modification protein DndE
MKPPVETVRVSQQGRDQLIKLKRLTGIEHWNSLSRLALCASLAEKSIPPQLDNLVYDGGVEMSWKVFSGDWSEALAYSLHTRATIDGLEITSEGLSSTLRNHLHRGLGYLVADRDHSSISDLLGYWLMENTR